jgi:hypothetical protein
MTMIRFASAHTRGARAQGTTADLRIYKPTVLASAGASKFDAGSVMILGGSNKAEIELSGCVLTSPKAQTCSRGHLSFLTPAAFFTSPLADI